MVGTKKVTTQLLDLSIKENFESVKDGTGKPLSMLEGAEELLGEIGAVINNLVKKVTSIVNSILSAIGNVISNVMKFIGKILGAIANAVKNAIKALMNILGIPMDALKNIAKSVMKFIQSALGTLGGWLKDILGLSNEAGNMSGLAGLLTSDITKTSLLAGILGYFSKDMRGLKSTTDRFVRDIGLEPVTKAYNKLFYNKKMGHGYYDSYYSLGDRYSDSSDRRVYNSLYNRSNRNRYDYFKNTKLDKLNNVLTRFDNIGISRDSSKKIIELSNIDDLDRMLPRNTRSLDYSKRYEDLHNTRRGSYTDIEKLGIVRRSSGLLNHKEVNYDTRTSDGLMNDYVAKRNLYEFTNKKYWYDGGTWYEKFVYIPRRPNINKPMAFLNREYKPSVLADQSRETEIERIATTVGVENVVLEKPLTYAEHQGFTKKVDVIREITKEFKPGRGRKLIFDV